MYFLSDKVEIKLNSLQNTLALKNEDVAKIYRKLGNELQGQG